MYINELPVIAPSSKIWLAEKGRWLTGMEKILVHMVPIHTLKWPAELHDGDLADLGGNTMHVMAVRLLSFVTSVAAVEVIWVIGGMVEGW